MSLQPQPPLRRRTGFTFVELLVVIVILGIVAALVVPRMAQSDEFAAQGAARMVVADLLYAQNNAIAEQAERKITFDTANQRYTITDAADNALPAPWLGGQYEVRLGDSSQFPGVRLQAADFGGDPHVTFDELGTPSAGGTINLAADAAGYRIQVTAFTGRVTVEPATGGN